jgi:hypothetical protein
VLQDGKLNLSGGTMTGDLTIPDKIIHSGDTNTAIRFPSADTVTVETAGSERMRVNSSGNVGIGTDSPAQKLEVTGGGNSIGVLRVSTTGSTAGTFASADFVTGTGAISIGSEGTGRFFIYDGSLDRFTFGAGTDSGVTLAAKGTGVIAFITNSSSERLRIDSAGNVGIGTTSPATELDVSGSIRASTGILFGTDTASANTLDDYEEGTFDFGITFGGASVDMTYGARGGKYTKIGRQVTVTGLIGLSNKGTSTGAATITGLPFTVFNNNANYSGISVGYLANITFADYIHGFARINETSISLREATNAGVNTPLTNADFANNSEILLSLTYFTS